MVNSGAGRTVWSKPIQKRTGTTLKSDHRLSLPKKNVIYIKINFNFVEKIASLVEKL